MMVLMVMASFGCRTSSPRGGGVSRDEGFTLVVPAFDTEIRQGQAQSVSILVDRDDYFKRDVQLEFTAPAGININPTRAMVSASDRPYVQLRISANEDAALGAYRVHVKGNPNTGQATATDLIVKVIAK